MMRRETTIGAIALLFFTVFWTAGVGLADFFVGRDALNAFRSEAFAATTGVVTSSEVTKHRGDEGPSFTPEIHYTYQVDGLTFVGERYSFSAFARPGSRWARDAVAEYPVGRTVAVHYDPDDPALSVLKPGLGPSNLFMLLFLTPFNVVALGLWWLVGPLIWHSWHGTKPRPVIWFRNGGATHVRLPYLPALASVFASAGVGAFIAIFVVGFTSSFYPDIDTVIVAWVFVLGFGAATGVSNWLMEQRGVFDLVIRERSVELPAMYGRAQRQTIDRATIQGGVMEKLQEKHSEKSATFEVRFERRDGGHETVVEWYDEYAAERLATWLREKLGFSGGTKGPRHAL